MGKWYVVHTRPRSEELATEHLRRQGYEVYSPRCSKTRRHARRFEQINVPLFPRYIFVKFDVEIDHWRPIKSTIGVATIICRNEKPEPIRDTIVEQIKEQEGENGLVSIGELFSIRPGALVKINSGAFMDQTGVFDCWSSGQRVQVLLNILGRNLKVSLPSRKIAAVA